MRGDETVVRHPWWVVALVLGGFPAAGVGLGWLAPVAARWAAALGWLPLPGPVELVARLPRPEVTIAAVALGAAGGLVLLVLAGRDDLRVAVGTDRVVLGRGNARTVVDRHRVAAAFVDDRRLVLLDPSGDELAREAFDLPAGAVAAAFRARGWPWRDDGDPYRDAFRRWVPDCPDLPAAAHALLRARERAVDSGDTEDAADLRRELARLHVVVRDDRKRQYWRRSGPAPG